MGNSNTQGSTAVADVVKESAAKRVGEKAVDRGLNAIVDFVKQKYGEKKVEIGTVFERYLENATHRYNQIRTLATGTAPRNIIGDNSLYVSIGLDYNGKEIDTASVDSILGVSKNVLILGSGGVGKSMLTRYLFLDTAMYEGYVPVLVELRRIGSQAPGQLSILELIYTCLQDFDAALPRDQFEYSLQLGKYLFLLDGFDEVKNSLAKETAEAIQAFSAKYPNNAFIVTSRPRTETSPLETFTVMNSMPLNKEQAVDLASRIWDEDEKTKEFCEQLKVELYEKHKDFAENPLLLTMMFLTFMRNSSIPEHLSDFYKKAYDALYSAHDNQDKGCYKRDFECKSLDENEFKQILSHFCFQSYFKEVYEFSEDEILKHLGGSLKKLRFTDVTPTAFLADLRNVVCLIVKDGDTYRFSHRSFQAYFAAYYTAHSLTDEQQRALFAETLSEEDVYWSKQDYYTLLIQIEPTRFAENALEDGLRKLYQDASGATGDPNLFLFKSAYDGISFESFFRNGIHSEKDRVLYSIFDDSYHFNLLALFNKSFPLPLENVPQEDYSNIRIIKGYMERISSAESFTAPNDFTENNSQDDSSLRELSFAEIDASNCITDDERCHLYVLLIQLWKWGSNIFERISAWLSDLDRKRASLKSPSFIDEL